LNINRSVVFKKIRNEKGLGKKEDVPKCAKFGNYWGDVDEISSGYTLYQMIDKYHKRKTKDYVIITETMIFLTREYDPYF
jgi:hypothetical protein